MFYTKKDIIERLLPVSALGLQKRNYKVLCSQAFMINNDSKSPYRLTHTEEQGIYFLYEGTYALKEKKSNITIVEVFNKYYGE